MDNSIVLKSYGKINLGLDVLRRREDGYHEVRMIMQTVGLYDLLTMKKIKDDKIQMTCNLTFLPTDERNLVYKAVKLMKDKYHIKDGVEINLNKRIPVAAGMAGGSSNCAAALKGMNQLFDLGLSIDELCEIGVTLGADVPYCVMRGTALAEGIGEKLTRLPGLPKCYVLVGKPGINVSTKLAYENLHLDQIQSHPDIDGMISDIENQDLHSLTAKMQNVFEPGIISQYPVIQEIKDLMEANGALKAMMSGSGPTVFGIFDDRSKLREATEALRNSHLAKTVFATQIYNKK